VDEAEVRATLAEFDPLWEVLIPAERARVLRLLLESVHYDGQGGTVEIRFRPGGIRALAEETRR
jgi:site-specific DNA recombinase